MAFPVIDTAAVYLISYFWERNKKACTGKSCTGFLHGKDRSWPELVSHAPDAVVDGFPAENDIRVNHKKFKQLEFLIGKQFVFSPDGDDAGGWV